MDNGNDGSVAIPIPPSLLEFGAEYEEFIGCLKERVRSSRVRLTLQANTELIALYWQIGNAISHEQERQGWGARVIDRISADLKAAFPDMKGFSSTNLKNMKRFARVWPDPAIGQQVVAQLPWGSNIVLMQKLATQEDRLWYAQRALEEGWSRSVLSLMIDGDAKGRFGGAPNNFSKTLPPADSEMAAHIFKDPYLFDFLGTDPVRRERILEDKLTEHIQDFLLELGRGFAFVGR